MAYNYTSWDALTYKSASKSSKGNKVYAIKASAARDGANMADAVAALGPPPAGMKVSGYNPNLVRTDKELAKNLGMNIKKEEATLNALAKEKNANALSNMTATPVEYAQNALVTNAADYKPAPAPTPTRTLQATYSTPTTEAAANPNNWRGDMRWADNPAVAAAYNAVYNENKGLVDGGIITAADLENWANKAAQQVVDAQMEVYNQNLTLLQSGIITKDQFDAMVGGATAQQQAAAKPFANDPRAQAAYDQMLASLQTSNMSGDEKHRLSMEAAKRKQQEPAMFDGLNDFLQNNPIGQVLAPILQTGVGVTAGAAAGGGVAAHLGSGMPATPAPNPAGYLPNSGGDAGTAAANSPYPASVQMPTINPMTAASGAFGSGIGTSNNLGMTPINTQTLGSGQTPPATVGATGNLVNAAGAVAALPVSGAALNTQPPGIPASPPVGTPMPGGTGGAIGSGIGTGTSGGTGTTDTGTSTGTGGTGTGAPSGSAPWYQDPSWLAALASMGTSLGAAWMQSSGAKEAAEAQAKAAADALALQKEQFNTQQKNIAPWLEAGTGALDQLKTFDADNPAFQFTNDDPSYTFRLNEGLKALQNSAAAKGMLQSGNTLRGITEYGQGLASTEYQNAFNRYQTTRGQKLNRLQSLAGVGQTAVQQANNASQNYTNGASNAMINQGQAQAGGITGSNDAWSMGLLGMGNALQGGLQNYYQNKQNESNNAMMRSLLGR